MEGSIFFLYIQGHESIKMASGSVVKRPPSSLPSAGRKKIVWFRYPALKKRTLENKNNLGEEDLCTKHGMSISACSVECGNRGTKRPSTAQL